MLVPKDGKMNGKKKKKTLPGTSLVVQRLRLHPSTAAGAGSILVRELRSHMPLCSQKKKQGKKKTHTMARMLPVYQLSGLYGDRDNRGPREASSLSRLCEVPTTLSVCLSVPRPGPFQGAESGSPVTLPRLFPITTVLLPAWRLPALLFSASLSHHLISSQFSGLLQEVGR